MEAVRNDGDSLPESNDIVVTGNEVEAHIILLTTINGEPGHHVAGVPGFSANINAFPETSDVRVMSLDDVCVVDEHIRVDVGSVNPFPGEILRQFTRRLYYFCLNCKRIHSHVFILVRAVQFQLSFPNGSVQ